VPPLLCLRALHWVAAGQLLLLFLFSVPNDGDEAEAVTVR
jgi:hypothetical protein